MYRSYLTIRLYGELQNVGHSRVREVEFFEITDDFFPTLTKKTQNDLQRRLGSYDQFCRIIGREGLPAIQKRAIIVLGQKGLTSLMITDLGRLVLAEELEFYQLKKGALLFCIN